MPFSSKAQCRLTSRPGRQQGVNRLAIAVLKAIIEASIPAGVRFVRLVIQQQPRRYLGVTGSTGTAVASINGRNRAGM
jgi:hypothetical protein